MQSTRYLLLAATALGLALATPVAAQDAPAPETPAADAPAADAPAAPDAPAEAPAAETPDAAAEEPATEAPAATEQPAPAAPDQPEIDVTRHGDWEVGCLAQTTNCEMQQVADDQQGNPVLLVRVLKLPSGSDAQALAILNTPLGTLLPAGLGFQIDSGEEATLPFEWCVQEGCVVRLGLRQPEIDAMKRGRAVRLTVRSIADADNPVELNLSLAGFTAAFDSLTTPPAPPAPPAQQ